MKISCYHVLLTSLVTSVVSVVTPVNRDTVPGTDSSLTAINLNTTAASINVSPVSQAIISGDHLYISGTLPLDPNTGEIVGQGNVTAQTLAVLANIKTIIEHTGSNLGKVVKVNVYLKNIDDLNIINPVYAGFFGTHRPARSAIEAAPTLNVLVEMDTVVRL